MNTLVRRIAQTGRAASAQAKYVCKRILNRSASETEAGTHRAPKLLLQNFEPPYWCYESSYDLFAGLDVSDVDNDTIPSELHEELFKH